MKRKLHWWTGIFRIFNISPSSWSKSEPYCKIQSMSVMALEVCFWVFPSVVCVLPAAEEESQRFLNFTYELFIFTFPQKKVLPVRDWELTQTDCWLLWLCVLEAARSDASYKSPPFSSFTSMPSGRKASFSGDADSDLWFSPKPFISVSEDERDAAARVLWRIP